MPKKVLWPPVVLCIVFVLSRIIFYLQGVRFDAAPLETAIHLIDPLWMKHNLMESLFHMVNQPPFFNLFVGVVYRIFPTNYPDIFHLIYMLHGLCLGMGLYILMRQFKVSSVLAVLLTGYFMINPAVILLENWLMYTYLIMTWLCLAAVFLFRYLKYAYSRDLVVFIILLTLLAMTKSIFHLFWMIGIVMLLWCVRSKHRSQILCVCVLPVLIVTSVYVKNYVISGSFTTSRLWMTLNLYEMSVKYISSEQLLRLSRNHEISIFSSDAVFEDALKNRQEDHMKTLDPIIGRSRTGIPMLDMVNKPTSGILNYHSSLQRMLEDVRLADASYLIKHYPESYRYSLLNAYLIMFFPSPTDVTFLNRTHIESYENLYNIMFARLNFINAGKLYSEHLKIWRLFLTLRWDNLSSVLYQCVAFFYMFLYGLAIVFLWKFWRNPKQKEERLVLLFMLFNIFYLICGSNFFAWIGSNRYRFVVEPFFLVIFAIAMTQFFQTYIHQKKIVNNVPNGTI